MCVFFVFFLTHSFPPSVIIDVIIPDVDLQWAPFPKLLMRRSQSANSHEEATDEQDAVFTVVCMFLTLLF